jgi:hypothetical protein
VVEWPTHENEIRRGRADTRTAADGSNMSTIAASEHSRNTAIQNVRQVETHEINETPENWQIYRRPSSTDPAFVELVKSISDTNINTPLELSADRYIISGHRRYLAAVQAGLCSVPAIIETAIYIGPMDSGERIALLTERNRGTRVKSDAELYLESAAKIDPEQAIREAQQRKAKHFNKAKCSVELVQVRGKSRRTNPSKARGGLLNAVLEIIEELRAKDHLPTSSRHIHYKLLSKQVRTSNYANGYVYGTRPGSSDALSKLLTDARSEGIIDPDAINDETRPTQKMEHDGSVAQYVGEKLDGLFGNYFSNVHADQPNHIELLIEKNTLFPLIFKHVAHKYRLPISSMRGYGSFPVSRDIASRFETGGKDSIVIIYISDLDPEGSDMPAAVKKYLMSDFGVDATVVRAAVTREQVERFNLPPDIDVKLSSSRAAGFIAEYGNRCWELDSMPAEILISETASAVAKFLDIDALNRAFQREQKADVELAKMTAAVTAFVEDKFRKSLVGAEPEATR